MRAGVLNFIRFPTISVSAAIALLLLTGATSPAQLAAPIPPERLNWNGDPKSPDISGVWIRAESPTNASGGKEGWLPWPPPLKPAFAKIWRKRVADAAAGTRTDDPIRACLPPGMPRFITGSTTALLSEISRCP